MGSRTLVVAGLFVSMGLARGASAQTPGEIHAEHRAGQTFLTWRELSTTGKHYRVYRADAPLASSADLAQADLLGEVDDRSSRNQGRSLATHSEQTWIIAPGGAPLAATQGLFVYTAERSSSTAYYAVTSVQGGKETKTLVPGANATVDPLVELPAPPEPVLQLRDAAGELWGHWVQNRDTPYQRALSLWPSHGYNFRYEPGTAPGPRGLVVRLHAGGQTYAQGWPQRFEVQKDVDILALSDLQPVTSWSAWFGAQEKLGSPPSSGTRVWNYTQQRVLWTLDWLTARLGAAHDPERVYAIGGSMGAIGSMYLLGEAPQRFAAALCRNGLYDLRATDYKNTSLFQTLFGSFLLDLPTRAGIPILERTNASYMANLDPRVEWPVIRTINGRFDETVGWMSAVELYQGLAASFRPAVHYFDERTHNPNGYWKGLQNTLLTRTFQTRRDRPSLRFSGCTLDDHPGNGQRLDGDLIGAIDAAIDYDPLTAASSSAALDFDVYLRHSGSLDDAKQTSAFAALTPRRTGAFQVAPGEAVRFTLREGATLVDEELLYADAYGLVHTAPVPFAIARRHARFEHAGESGTPTAAESATGSTPAGATVLALGSYGIGALATPDESDYWRVQLTAGSDATVEVLAARRDPAAWNAAGAPPTLRILAGDGASELARHDPLAWPAGARDLDFPRWRVPADGEYLIELSSAGRGGGAYGLRVSAASTALAPELEPPDAPGANDAPEGAEPIVPGTPVAGHAEPGALDWYAFELQEPGLVSLELWMQRLGLAPGASSYAAADLHLADPSGELVFPGNRLGDPSVRLLLAAGTHLVGVAPRADGGDYVLALGVQPFAGVSEGEPNGAGGTPMPLELGAGVVGDGDDDAFAFGGTAGERVELELLDSGRIDATPFDATLLGPVGFTPLAAAPVLGRIAALLPAAGEHVLSLQLVGPYFLRLADAREARFESEGNDDLASAGPLWNGRVAGRIDGPGDVDHFAFGAPVGKLVRLELHGPGAGVDGTGYGSALAPRLTILDRNGNVLASAEDSPASLAARGVAELGPALTLGFAPALGGTYFARVEDVAGAGGAAFGYWLEVR